MICRECDNDTFAEVDGFFYCQQCGVQADDIIATAVDDDDFVGEGGGTRGAMYQPINTRRLPSQHTTTPSQPRYTQETLRYSQFRSQLELTSQIPKSATGASVHDHEPTEPADFGAVAEGEALCYEDYYQETRDRYVKGFLMMITYQCDALVEKFNVTPLIIGLVGPICLRFVALSGVYDDDWADKAIHDSELQSQEEIKGEAREGKRRNRDKDKDIPRNLDGKNAVMIWVSQLRKSLPLSSSLAISFLACLKAGSPVLPTDIVRWAQEGEIPYLSCFLKIQEQAGVRSAACPVEASIMFRPRQIVSAHRLETRAALIADVIGLALPPVDFYGIASNYLKQLSIPEDKVLDLVRLIGNWSIPTELYLSKNEHRLPTRVCVMSILIVAIRMLYNINGFGVWECSLGLVDVAGEADVVSEERDSSIHYEEVTETKSVDAALSDVTKGTEFDTEELLKNLEMKYYEVAAETVEYEKNLSSYLSHGKKDIFAGLEEASADDTYITVDNLWNCYSNDKEFERCRTPSKRGRDWGDVLSVSDDKFGDGNSSSCGLARKSKFGSTECDELSLEFVSSPNIENSKEGALRRLITDMEENLFCYIPPRVKVKRLGYLHYVRKKGDGALIYAAHADYYILLRVCARVSEIDVRNMHRGVLSFERRLVWIERRVDQVLHPPIHSRTCETDTQ